MSYIGNQSSRIVYTNLNKFKGAVADLTELAAVTGASSGDMYKVEDSGHAHMYDGTQWVDMGPIVGPQGVKGTGITSVVRTSGDGSEGTVDTYTITYDDTSTSTFEVRNGTAGTINHIAKTDTVGTTDTYTVYADAAETQPLGTFEVYNGVDGEAEGLGTAAARDVGTSDGQLPEFVSNGEGLGGFGYGRVGTSVGQYADVNDVPKRTGFYLLPEGHPNSTNNKAPLAGFYDTSIIRTLRKSTDDFVDVYLPYHQYSNGMVIAPHTSSGYTTQRIVSDSVNLRTTTGNSTTYPMSQKAVTEALDTKVDKVPGKQLSTEDYTTADKNKLNGLAAGGVGIIPPTITSPVDGAVDVVLGPTITTSSYATTESFAGAQTSGILEIATDVEFNNVVFSSADGTTSFVVSGLPDNTLLYARAKHISGNFSSLWGPVSTFTTMDIVVTQPVVSVSGSPDSITRTPTISGSTFSVAGGTDTHASTSWKAVRTSDSVTVWESLLDSVNLTAIQVPAGNLEIGTEYSFECRYHGTQYGSSTFGSYVGTVANLFVNKPILTVQGAPTSVGETPVLSTNAFSTNLESDTHTSTTWVVKQAGVVVWSSVADTTNLLSITMPSDVLEVVTEYTFEVYHTGASLGDSLIDTVTATTAANFSIQYGLVWNDVDDTYTRTGAAVGWSTGADFTNNETVQSKMKRCVLNSDGTVNYYLDPNNSNLKADGTASKLDGTDGNVMVEIPKLWVKYENTTGAKSMSISTAPASGYVLHPAFVKNGVEVDYRYYRAYKGSVNGSKLISRSGVSAASSQTIAAFRTLARSNGAGWGLVDWYLLFAVQTLLFVEIGTFDSQAVLGNGNDTGGDYGMTTGGSNSIGNASSPSTNDDTWMSYRGIENFYADIFEFIDGINVSEKVVYTSNTQSTFASDVFTGDYTSTGVTLPASGYIRNMDFSINGFIPTVSGGSTTTFVPDQVWSNAGARVVRFGGYAGLGLYCGAAYLNAYGASSDSGAGVGAGLSF